MLYAIQIVKPFKGLSDFQLLVSKEYKRSRKHDIQQEVKVKFRQQLVELSQQLSYKLQVSLLESLCPRTNFNSCYLDKLEDFSSS